MVRSRNGLSNFEQHASEVVPGFLYLGNSESSRSTLQVGCTSWAGGYYIAELKRVVFLGSFKKKKRVKKKRV